MEPFDRRSPSERSAVGTRGVAPERTESRSRAQIRTPKAYRVCDGLSGGLILFMIVFTPWAFGTTQEWSIWTMNITAYALGLAFAAKHVIRRQTGYTPPRWDRSPESDSLSLLAHPRSTRDYFAFALAVLTVFILAYILVSAVNARARYLEGQGRFEYRDCIRWLPHSYDSASTWFYFWMYSGLACFFWAARDWLLGKSSKERRRSKEPIRDAVHIAPPTSAYRSSAANAGAPEPIHPSAPLLPGRLRLLLWVLCINGSVLALESILQRLSGTDKLLWLVQPRFNTDGAAQFGPYAYRANAASYFNLVWPVCLGFWLVLRQMAKPSLRQGGRVGSGNHLVLLPGAVLMAACPIIATTRGGALVAAASILAAMAIVLWSSRRESRWFKAGVCSLFIVILGLSGLLGYKQLAVRFTTIFTDQMSRRTEIYDNALPIARDFPVFGTGAGTFGALYQLYRSEVNQEWASYVHDDWLETRITFGWVGFSALLLTLCSVLARWFFGGGIPAPIDFVLMAWVSIGGSLLHAKFDFPFQIYSVLFVFLLLLAVCFCLSKAERHAS